MFRTNVCCTKGFLTDEPYEEGSWISINKLGSYCHHSWAGRSGPSARDLPCIGSKISVVFPKHDVYLHVQKSVWSLGSMIWRSLRWRRWAWELCNHLAFLHGGLKGGSLSKAERNASFASIVIMCQSHHRQVTYASFIFAFLVIASIFLSVSIIVKCILVTLFLFFLDVFGIV